MSSYFHVLTSGKLYNSSFLSPLCLKGMMLWHFKLDLKKKDTHSNRYSQLLQKMNIHEVNLKGSILL